MEATYRGLGFDPAPGEPGAVTRAAAQFTEAAEALAGLGPALRRARELAADWHGGTAEAFRSRLGAISSDVDSRERVLRRAARVLERWADVLVANQRRAEELDRRAVIVRKRIESAADELADRQNATDLAATPVAAAHAAADLAAANTRLAGLESALADVLAEARRLERDHLRAAEAFADELAGERGEDVPRQAGAASPAVRLAGELLTRGSRTSGTLAGLLLPRGSGTAVPAGAAGALAAALGTHRR